MDAVVPRDPCGPQKRRWRRQWALTTGPAHWHRHGIQTFKAWQEESRGTWEAWDAWGLVECKVAWSSHGGREACSRRGMQAWRHAVSGGMPSWRHAVMEACVSGSPLVAQRMRLCGCRGAWRHGPQGLLSVVSYASCDVWHNTSLHLLLKVSLGFPLRPCVAVDRVSARPWQSPRTPSQLAGGVPRPAQMIRSS